MKRRCCSGIARKDEDEAEVCLDTRTAPLIVFVGCGVSRKYRTPNARLESGHFPRSVTSCVFYLWHGRSLGVKQKMNAAFNNRSLVILFGM
jgi:hypothetical protein